MNFGLGGRGPEMPGVGEGEMLPNEEAAAGELDKVLRGTLELVLEERELLSDQRQAFLEAAEAVSSEEVVGLLDLLGSLPAEAA